MIRGWTDLAAEDIERLAAEVWDDAAREALARGSPVTVYHDGRLFRYHPGRGIEELTPAPVDTTSATSSELGPPKQSPQSVEPPAGSADERDAPALPPVDLAAAADSPTADQVATQSPSRPVGADEAARSAPAEAAPAPAAAANESLTEYGLKAIAFARANADATLHFAARLFAAKTFSEVVELSAAHARRQLEMFSAQGKDLAALAPDRGDGTAEPTKNKRGKAVARGRSAA